MLQGLAYLGEEKKKEALASFRSALKISPDYLPALEGAAQIEFDAGSQAAVPLLQNAAQGGICVPERAVAVKVYQQSQSTTR